MQFGTGNQTPNPIKCHRYPFYRIFVFTAELRLAGRSALLPDTANQ